MLNHLHVQYMYTLGDIHVHVCNMSCTTVAFAGTCTVLMSEILQHLLFMTSVHIPRMAKYLCTPYYTYKYMNTCYIAVGISQPFQCSTIMYSTCTCTLGDICNMSCVTVAHVLMAEALALLPGLPGMNIICYTECMNCICSRCCMLSSQYSTVVVAAFGVPLFHL